MSDKKAPSLTPRLSRDNSVTASRVLRPAIDLQALEDRVLYSAGPIPMDASICFESGDPCVELECLDRVDANLDFAAVGFELLTWDHPEPPESLTSLTDGLSIDPVDTDLELLIVDDSVDGYQELVGDVLQGSESRNVEVVYLSNRSDGLDQITALLKTRTNIGAIHLVSHGSDGEIRLGASQINGDNLGQFQDQMSAWKTSLTDDADLLIYGCNVAGSVVGEAFVSELALLLDVDVLANTGVTGHVSLHGDWSFEFEVGRVESEVAFSDQIQSSWVHTLPVALNASPIIATNTGATVEAGSVGNVITAAMLNEGDPDDSGADITYTITTTVEAGTLRLDGSALVDGSQFTQADIDLGRLSYDHEGSISFDDGFGFEMSDGGEDASTPVTGTFEILVHHAPTDLASGIEINADGGNDLYLAVNGGGPTSVLNGMTTLTVEASFLIGDQPGSSATLFSYHVGGTDEFTVGVQDDGELRIRIKDFNYDSTGKYAQLLDGNRHHVAVSWNSAGGVMQIFVDGALAETIDEVQSGEALGSNGVLVFGQDQDSENGGFDDLHTFSGTLFDIRIWAEDRTELEVASNYQHQFDSQNIPGGLVASWQMKSLSGAGNTLSELVNPGANDALVEHVGNGGGFSTSFATHVLHVDQSAIDGSTVGFVIPTDIEFFESIVQDGLFNSNVISDSQYEVFAFDGSQNGNRLGEWTVVANAIDVRGTSWDLSPQGGRVIDLVGGDFGVTGQGTIEQTIETVAGQEYELQFALSGNYVGFETEQWLNVNVDGNSTAFRHVEGPGWSKNNLQWVPQSLFFTATSDSTVLQFEATTGFFRGAMIGDVHVVNAEPAAPTGFSFQILDDAGGRFDIDSATGQITVADASLLDFGGTSSYSVLVEVTDPDGPSYQETIPINLDAEFDLSGRVLEDVDGNGDITENVGFFGADVYLYRDNGDGGIGIGDILVDQTTTNAAGEYTFNGLQNGVVYFTVVDSKSLVSGALNAGYGSSDVWAEQTYGSAGSLYVDGTIKLTSSDGAFFSGKSPDASDDASSLWTAEHVTRVEINSSPVTNVDFGFSFNVVTNSDGGDARDDDGGANQRSVQGSLRQFMTNANAIDGANAMKFVPVAAADLTNGSNSRWEISVSTALPILVDEGTTIDGRAFLSDGITRWNSNSAIHGYVGTVGTGSDGVTGTGDEFLLEGVDAPELEISGDGSVGTGFSIQAGETEIGYVAVHGFGLIGSASGNILVDGAGVRDVHIHHNILGTRADAFVAPDTALQQTYNIFVQRADQGVIEHNLIGFARDSGIKLERNANNWTIDHNEIRSNSTMSLNQDGIELITGSRRATISANLIIGNPGHGIDTWRGNGGHLIFENTIVENGFGGSELGGIRLMGNGNSVQQNVIWSNNGAGVHVIGAFDNGSQSFDAAINNLISRNSFAMNTGISIDHSSSNSSMTILNQGDGISTNALATDLEAGNDGLDHPTLTIAFLAADGLHVLGQLDPSLNVSEIELYLADSGAGDFLSAVAFGEGKTYLGNINSTNRISSNSITGEFEAVLSEPVGGWPTELTTGGAVTAIAIQDGTNNTSEFGNSQEVDLGPVALDSSIVATETQPFVFARSDFQFLDPDDAVYESIQIMTLPSGGDLYLNGTLMIAGDIVSASEIDAGLFSYRPDAFQYGIGYDQFAFRVRDDAQPSGNSAVLSIDVTPVNDAPVFGSVEKWTIQENQTEIGVVNATDVDGDSISYAIVGGADQAWFTIDSANGRLQFVVAPDHEVPTDSNTDNVYRLNVEASDGQGGVTRQDLEITVADVAEAPVAQNDVIRLDEGRAHVQDVTINDWDAEGGAFKVSIIDGPKHGNAYIDGQGRVVYRHDGSETARDALRYQITDASGLTDQAIVMIQINPVDDPTLAVSDRLFTAFEQESVVGQEFLLSNDIDPDSTISEMEVIILNQPTHGVVDLVNGVLTFTPEAGFFGVTSFEYQVDVNGVVGNSSVVTIVVGPSPGITSLDQDSGTDNEEESGNLAPANFNPSANADEEEVDHLETHHVSYFADDDSLARDGLEDRAGKNSDQTDKLDIELSATTYAYKARTDDVEMTSLARSLIVTPPSRVNHLATTFAGLMWDDLDSAKRDFMMGQVQLGVPTIAASAASFLTVGYLAWIVRGGVLLTTFMSSVPAWSSFDILSVIDSGTRRDESIEQMVDS